MSELLELFLLQQLRGESGARRLALFHHDPTHDDEAIKKMEDVQRRRVAAAGSSLDVFAAAEGMEFGVSGKGGGKTIIEISNPLTDDMSGLVVGHTTSAAEEIAKSPNGADLAAKDPPGA